MTNHLQALQFLKAAAVADLPVLFSAAELDDVSRYTYGGTVDSQDTELAFYLGPGDADYDFNNFKPVVQLQLPRVNYEDGLKYFDIVFKYFYSGLDPVIVGMTALNRIMYTEFPPDETSSCIFSFFIEYQEQLDGCS